MSLEVTVHRAALAVARDDRRRPTVITTARSAGPLRLLAPRGRGGAAWVYQASLGGGFVGDDALALGVRVGTGAALWLGSQASSKVYRAARAKFELDAVVGDDAALVVWPEPVTCFAGAALVQRQRFALAASARLVVVDAFTAGRVARGERWAFERLELGLAIDRAGAPLVRDAVVLDPRHGPLAARMAGLDAHATAILVGVPVAPLVASIAAQPVPPRPGAPLVAASEHPWGAVVRLAAATAEDLATVTRALIAPLVTLAIGDPCS